jgi:hypothetical protein
MFIGKTPTKKVPIEDIKPEMNAIRMKVLFPFLLIRYVLKCRKKKIVTTLVKIIPMLNTKPTPLGPAPKSLR